MRMRNTTRGNFSISRKLIQSQLGFATICATQLGNFIMSRKLIQSQLGFATICATQRRKL
jgi:hypothetical protein